MAEQAHATNARYLSLRLTCWACHYQRHMTLPRASIGPDGVPQASLHCCCHRCGSQRIDIVVTENGMTGLPRD